MIDICVDRADTFFSVIHTVYEALFPPNQAQTVGKLTRGTFNVNTWDGPLLSPHLFGILTTEMHATLKYVRYDYSSYRALILP